MAYWEYQIAFEPQTIEEFAYFTDILYDYITNWVKPSNEMSPESLNKKPIISHL